MKHKLEERELAATKEKESLYAEICSLVCSILSPNVGQETEPGPNFTVRFILQYFF